MDSLGDFLHTYSDMQTYENADTFAFKELDKLLIDQDFADTQRRESNAVQISRFDRSIPSYYNVLINRINTFTADDLLDSIKRLANLILMRPALYRMYYFGEDGEVFYLSKHDKTEFAKSIEFNRLVENYKQAVDKKSYAMDKRNHISLDKRLFSKEYYDNAKKYGVVKYNENVFFVSEINKEFEDAENALKNFGAIFSDYSKQAQIALQFYEI